MKICFVGPANSSHIMKWSRWFSGHGHEVHIVSFQEGEVPGATVHYISTSANAAGSDLNKLFYLLKAGKVRRTVRAISPEIINVHYATSYGTVMALTGIRNYILSVWGSDIYEFPEKSILHRLLLQFSLKRADTLFSTSLDMANKASRYTKKSFHITPFGVDMELFSPDRRTRTDHDKFVVGIVKLLEKIYGIDYLLRAVARIRKGNPEIPISVRICGYGSQEEPLRELANQLGIGDITSFSGKIPQAQAATEWADMDVAVIPSIHHESFGVAAVEAQACGIPVIVSNVGGLTEVTEPDKTSIVVPTKDEDAIAKAILQLYENPDLCHRMGQDGRKRVLEKYELNQCFRKIESIYLEQLH